MNKTAKLTAIIGGIILVIVLIVLFSLILGGDSKNLVDDPGIPDEYRLRIVTTEDIDNNLKMTINKFDGYKITVPLGWLVNDAASFQGGLNIYSDPASIDIESYGGTLLNILTVNNLENIKEFIPESVEFDEIEISEEIVYRASYKVFESYVDESRNPIVIPINNSGTIAYIFSGDKNYYFIRCTVVGDEDYTKLLSECEEQIKTFEITK